MKPDSSKLPVREGSTYVSGRWAVGMASRVTAVVDLAV
jgi:hypothetical protein